MRPYSQIEKQIITALIDSGKELVTLTDFISPCWPIGQFEISSYQQKLFVYLPENGMEVTMRYLLEVLDLMDYLDMRGYISSWSAFPMADNTRTCGERPEDAHPQYLPDLSVASNLLTLANRKYKLNDSLKDLQRRNFASIQKQERRTLIGTIIAGFCVLASVGLLNVYTDYLLLHQGVREDLKALSNENVQVLENQQLEQKVLDSLTKQTDRIMSLTLQTSTNTARYAELETLLRQHQSYLYRISNDQKNLRRLILENRQESTKNDSLLNKSRFK